MLPILIHGDAAFAGQGVVAETLNLSQLRGYRTGGTVHVVINNQVGFTTSPASARSSVYSTDVARMIQAPIFHVNGDDPEAVVRVAELAYEFRQAFKKDVVIDMLCYRRRGHSEVDEPSFTQPVMYDLIDAKRSVRKLYTESLIGRGDITVEEAEAALRDYQGQLERVFAESRDMTAAPLPRQPAEVAGRDRPRHGDHRRGAQDDRRQPGLDAGGLHRAPAAAAAAGEAGGDGDRRRDRLGDGRAHRDRLAAARRSPGPARRPGHPARHVRPAPLGASSTGAPANEYTPLAHLSDDQATVLRLRLAALASTPRWASSTATRSARPDALVLWEAQFGDFANGAQEIIDEFISASEAKWGQRSGVVLLLPHGYEGQGPDHSSARIERYLAMSAEDNWTVASAVDTRPTTSTCCAARRCRGGSKPLIVFTPKSMLRLRAASSMPEDFTSGRWQPVIADPG